MVDVLWGERIGRRGVIDCCFDPVTKTVVAGDLDGSVVWLDQSGGSIGTCRVDMPIWGVAQAQRYGSHLIAIASADKETGEGHGYLFSDLKKTTDFSADGELWDCVFVDQAVYFTSWSSHIYALGLESKDIGKYSAPGTPYGLAIDSPQSAIVALNGVGIGELRPSGDGVQVRVARQFPDACYNVCGHLNSEHVVTGTKGGAAAILTALTQERGVGAKGACAVALSGDFLLAGDLDGTLSLFHLGEFTRALRSMVFPGSVWNVEIDPESNLAYVACGDGNLYCLDVDLRPLPAGEIARIRDSIQSPLDGQHALSLASEPAGIEVALGMIEDEWERWSNADIEGVAALADLWLKSYDSPRLRYILGLAELERSRSDEAILQFQRIDEDPFYEVKALLPLGRALHATGSTGAAIRVLRMGLPRIPGEEQAEYLFAIARLHDKQGDKEHALEAYELVSALDHSHPGLRDALDRLRQAESPEKRVPGDLSVAVDSLDVDPDRQPQLSNRRTDNYSALTYFLYEYGSPEDEAKKHMETELMKTVAFEALGDGGRSLDVGCATGRWPEWFARKGYDSYGFDISPESIEICERRAEQHPHLPLTFERYDIADGARMTGFFEVATCMMGTFNHVPPDRRVAFLRGVRDSLVPGGGFVVSIWNVSSPFCEFLSLDGQQAREEMQRNGLELDEMVSLLRTTGFEVGSMTPFCFLPNECYRVWEDEFQDGVAGMLRIENQLRSNLTAQIRNQMSFIVARAVDRT